jgi:glycosyltransferase involved in cell wall biosynthesis
MLRAMRVLTVGNMYPPHHLGGYELMWRAAVRELRAEGHAARVLTTDHRERTVDPEIPEDDDVHRELEWYWSDHRFPRYRLRRRLAIERHNRAVLADHLTDFRPDVVCWFAMGGMSLSMLEQVRRAGLAAAGAVHDDWMIYARGVDGWQRAFDRPGLRRLAERLTGVPTGVRIDRAASWSFVSEYVRERAVAAGLDVGACPVIHSGIDEQRFEPAPAREWQNNILCLGRIDPRKGVATAIKALPELPGYTLRCVGGGDQAHLDELRQTAAELAVGDRVRFETLPRSEVPTAYATADVLAFCVSWPEPFGLVPLEAMAVGRPVVATGTGGSAEFLEHEGNCLLVARDDPQALAAAIGRIAADPALRERLREGGFATAARFTERRFAVGLRQLIEQRAQIGGRPERAPADRSDR